MAIFKMLLDRGANTNVTCYEGHWDGEDHYSPLVYYAAKNNDEEIVDLLIEHGADVRLEKDGYSLAA